MLQVVVLVDRRHLYRNYFRGVNFFEGWVSRCFKEYVGHYVLVVGYDAPRDGYYVYDPARAPEPQFVHASDLHVARRCHGTDEDLIVVPWHNKIRYSGERCKTSAVAAAIAG